MCIFYVEFYSKDKIYNIGIIFIILGVSRRSAVAVEVRNSSLLLKASGVTVRRHIVRGGGSEEQGGVSGLMLEIQNGREGPVEDAGERPLLHSRNWTIK